MAQAVQCFSFGDAGGLNPADATTYHFGSRHLLDAAVSTETLVVIMPDNGTVTAAYGNFVVGGTLASAGNSTLSVVNLTAVTNEVISSAVALTANPTRFSNTSMSLAFSAGDEFEISWLTPTWATNPTVVFGRVYVLVNFT